MNPLFQSVVGSLLRKLLAMASVWVVSQGIFTTDETMKLIEAGILLGTSILWTLWKNYGSHILLNTALESPAGLSLVELKAKIADGKGAIL